MKTKEIRIKYTLISAVVIFLFIILVFCLKAYFTSNNSYAKETVASELETVDDSNDGSDKLSNQTGNLLNEKDIDDKIDGLKISNANEVDIQEVIDKNKSDGSYSITNKKEEVLEYLTQYKTNNNVPKGISYVVQEGRQGKQEIVTKSTYDVNGNLINEEQVEAKITKAALSKIVEVGGANYTRKNSVKKGDTVYVTSDMLSMWAESSENSRKITTLKQNENVKVLDIKSNWYKIAYNGNAGWIKAECTLNTNLKDNSVSTDKQGLLKTLNFNMALNKPSGLTLEQFKKILSDDKDTNKIFERHSEYFYYIENQYNINGVFVAAVGIHESNWGTSKIAIQKNNLFGYGAYDSNPYNGAYNFSNYSESIDLIARVFSKYYLNPKGTSIYGGETAVATYYSGATLTGVNTKYATDKNWANSVYKYMQYLYNKL